MEALAESWQFRESWHPEVRGVVDSRDLGRHRWSDNRVCIGLQSVALLETSESRVRTTAYTLTFFRNAYALTPVRRHSETQSASRFRRLSQINDSFVSGLEEVLHDRMVLLQESLHAIDELFGVLLSLLVLSLQSGHLIVEVALEFGHVNMEALLIGCHLDIEEAFICLVVIGAVMNCLVDVEDFLLDLLGNFHNLFSESLELFQSTAWSIENSLRDKYVGISHELLVLAHLLIKQVWEDVSCDHLLVVHASCHLLSVCWTRRYTHSP